MKANFNQQAVKHKAVELAFAAKTVLQQLTNRDRTPEGLEACRILEEALTNAIPNAPMVPPLAEQKATVAA